jgi:hypothetical protein
VAAVIESATHIVKWTEIESVFVMGEKLLETGRARANEINERTKSEQKDARFP